MRSLVILTNEERLIKMDVARKSLANLIEQAHKAKLLPDEHFYF